MASSSIKNHKTEISFDALGNPVGDNKKRLLSRILALLKCHVGLLYDDWRNVDSELKEKLWTSLLQDFDLSPTHKDRIFRQAGEQYRKWKNNLRRRTFGESAPTEQDILRFRDHNPENEAIPIAEWNRFIEIEATEKKLQQRVQNKANRAKKTDVHFLGAKSYAQASAEWTERIQGTDDEGTAPTRTNLYLHARRTKSGEYRPDFIEAAAKLVEIQDSQGGGSSSTDIDNDPLTQVFGKDKSGRTRGVGSKVSRTKYKATQPLVSELDQLKREVKDQGSKLETIISVMKNQESMLKTIVEGQPIRDSDLASPESSVKKVSTIGEGGSTQPSPMQAHKGYYHLRDLNNSKDIAMATIETVSPGTIVHGRPLQCPEAKVIIIKIYPDMGNEPVYLGRQGGGTCLEDFGDGSFIAWPVYLLKEIAM